MLVYAEPNDLLTGNWVLEVPDNATALMRQASIMVRNATRVALYDTLPSGLPEDDDIREAMRDAVCAQVTAWTEAGINPVAGAAGRTAQIASQSADGGSVTYGNLVSAEEYARASTRLCSLAIGILVDVNLISTRPLTW